MGECAQSLTSHSATRLIGKPDLAASDLIPGEYEGVHLPRAFCHLDGWNQEWRYMLCRAEWTTQPVATAGGLKLWESAVDLANFLLERFANPAAADGGSLRGNMRGMRVIELGCGHGLPGIICALAGAEVCFQVLAELKGSLQCQSSLVLAIESAL